MIDPWQKAAECARAIRESSDPEQEAVLTQLRNLWIVIANEKTAGISGWQAQAENANRVHAELVRPLH